MVRLVQISSPHIKHGSLLLSPLMSSCTPAASQAHSYTYLQGKKKKSSLPWCFYCDREFEDDKILVNHQKAKVNNLLFITSCQTS